MIESSKRLLAVFHKTPKGYCVGDIGCDHGYISHALLEANRAEKVIATDISAPSLNKAATLLADTFRGRFETRLGDGFAPIAPGEIDGAIVMGMGGHLIADILSRGRDVVEALHWCIVQPMQGAEDLFDYLSEGGFHLLNVDLIEERGKFYPLMKIAAGGADVVSWRNFLSCDDFLPMAEKEKARLEGVVEAVRESGREDIIEKAEKDVEKWEAYIEQCRNCR
ncbi:MAG: class I SAM-dependent methyltransferase [Peptoniphilus sp.]|nr:class I SAM-dependent methyltransferase [Peptoniphilus sp.]MDY3118894.1 class I SAM-dependent methyltransferase [Peptoniphilus sp.]